MAEFTLPCSSSHPIMAASAPSPGSSSASFDDSLEDVCSICLESFSVDDPATVTTCKHEYHLQCILEWSQRSSECPICWQSLILGDPSSQKLLAAVEAERSSRARRNHLSYSLHNSNRDHRLDHEPPYTGGFDFSDRIVQQMATTMNRTRQICRSQRRRNMEAGHFHDHAFHQPHPISNMQQMHQNSAEDQFRSGDRSSEGRSPLADGQPSLSQIPQIFCMTGGTRSNRDGHVVSRMSSSHSLPNDNQGTMTPDLLAFSEPLKCSLSAVSARYRDSISKGTQGFWEKVLAHNTSVKELSKGVQREMSASISGLAKVIERLDLRSKRSSSASNGFDHIERESDVFSKGKEVQESVIHESENEANINIVQCLHMERSSHATCSIGSPRGVSYSKGGN